MASSYMCLARRATACSFKKENKYEDIINKLKYYKRLTNLSV